jgi:hypothetical protein
MFLRFLSILDKNVRRIIVLLISDVGVYNKKEHRLHDALYI